MKEFLWEASYIYITWSMGGCLHLLINKWHWLQKPNFQLGLGEGGLVSTCWSTSDTDFKNLSSNFGWGREGMSLPLISKWHWLLKPNFQLWPVGGCLCPLISNWHWLLKPSFQLWPVGCCHCLLISNWHWLQKHNFQLWGREGLSPPFDQ